MRNWTRCCRIIRSVQPPSPPPSKGIHAKPSLLIFIYFGPGNRRHPLPPLRRRTNRLLSRSKSHPNNPRHRLVANIRGKLNLRNSKNADSTVHELHRPRKSPSRIPPPPLQKKSTATDMRHAARYIAPMAPLSLPPKIQRRKMDRRRHIQQSRPTPHIHRALRPHTRQGTSRTLAEFPRQRRVGAAVRISGGRSA